MGYNPWGHKESDTTERLLCVCVCVCVCVCMHACSGMSDSFQPPWTVTYQAPLSMGFPRQEYRRGLPFPSPGDLPNPGIEPVSPVSPALVGGFFTIEPPGKPENERPFPN